MNLVQTVSAIVGKEVDIKFAMDFAINQFGVLSTYLQRPKNFTYIMIGSEDATMWYSRLSDTYTLENWKEEFGSDIEVGKYANNLLDRSLLKMIEDYGSFVFLDENEYNTLK